ncbi:hypothetical protein [Sphingomonas sp.]|uniref:hypothetical protein n=1 Tax=Sphingomonas sp. TaxID=28214 RepID=UPI0035C84221
MKKATLIATIALACAPAGAQAQSFGKILDGLSRKLSAMTGSTAGVASDGRPPVNASGHRVSAAPAFGSIARTDVAGVRLGMTPTAVRSALATAGYDVDGTTKHFTFEQMVMQKAASRNPALHASFHEEGIGEITAHNASGQRMSVRFVQMPAGPVASYIYTTIDDRRITRASFAQAIREKYGPSTDAQTGMMWYYWCNGGTVDCAERIIGGDFPFMIYTAGPATPYLELSDENVSGKLQAALLATEVDRVAPMQRARL